MIDSNKEKNTSNKNLLIQYASLGAQILAGLIVAVAIGYWLDEKIKFSFPVFIWLLPLLVIIAMILKAVRDTSKK
ncbi:MAG TPA: AtpZ/AtpI family protein [Parafilimonas sp.]|nr:AtpZ/AtpI family protein [Parafilimonas sp.]